MPESGTSKVVIPYYNEINTFLESIPVDFKMGNPDLCCFRLQKGQDGIMYKPPFRRGFYFVGLVSNAETTRVTYDNSTVNNLNSFLVFQSPGLIYSFHRDPSAYGYLIYFKSHCFHYFKPLIEEQFPFFHIQHTDFYKLTYEKFEELSPCFAEVFSAFESFKDHTIASLKLLALLYRLKDFSTVNNVWQQRMATPQQVLVKKFVTLVNTRYLEKRLVDDYAQMLFVTTNHLSQSVKSVSGKNALSHINERIIAEAKPLINYTDKSIAEIAYTLDFSDPANFGKFFKKQVGISPLEFRVKQAK